MKRRIFAVLTALFVTATPVFAIQGKKPPKPVAAPKENVVNLAEVLRKSLEKEGIKAEKAKKPAARRKSAA